MLFLLQYNKINFKGFIMILNFYKLLFVLFFAFIGYHNSQFKDISPVISAVTGGCFALFLILIIEKIKKSELKYLWSSTLGILSGVILGWAMFEIFKSIAVSSPFQGYIFFKILFLVGFPLTGLFIGIQKSNMFSPLNIKEFFRGSSIFTESFLLDTSAIIDGRIVPITESGFIEGELIITQFVLAELQMIADSHDKDKRIRGRRGLDIIDKLRNNPHIPVTISNKTVGEAKSVDQKLVLLAKELNLKLVTNDINLSKIAKLQDIKVLNINNLAFALKPVVYPGERLKVSLAGTGKEKNQAVAYLDDGTMIIVENARHFIGKEIKIEVTSVLQTTSGKMIFGKKINGKN